MDAERWRQVNDLFHAALERDAAERDAFVAESGADEDVRAEVGSLLAAHAASGDFIERPAFETGAALLHGDPQAGAAHAPLAGARLGPYAIGDSIGHGGMGVVYLARDTRLERAVAIKALAGHLVGDERSRERLRREAKAAAALSHPGIATVFALEEFDDNLYIVYEYAEGPTLRQELDAGPQTFGVVLDTALALARALEAAHGLGIVHRDLKPENVVRVKGGGIKILDFGLASFQVVPGTADAAGPSGERLTLPGTLIGTPSYMAPEQLRGRSVDFRADLFSLGVLLYEMASGVHPFEGDDPASTIARIIEVEPPDIGDVVEIDRPELARIVGMLLHKDPTKRYAATSELVADLERVVDGTTPAPASAEPPRPSVHSATGGEVIGGAASARGPRHNAFWWWRFHQLTLSVVYGVSFYGLWWVDRVGAPTGLSVVSTFLAFGAIAPVMLAGSLRLHLAFTSRYYPDQLVRQRRRSTPLIHAAELVYALLLLAAATLVAREHPLVAVPLFAVAVGIVVVARLIEPTTTRAAFPGQV